MANAVISKYLSDTSIPAETRRKIAEGVNSGGLSEAAAIQGITAKYGAKYGTAPAPTSMAGNLAKGIVGAANPANWGKIGAQVAGTAAVPVIKSMAAAGAEMTPEQVQTAQAASAKNEQDRQAQIGFQQQLGNKFGVLPEGTGEAVSKMSAEELQRESEKINMAQNPMGEVNIGIAKGVGSTVLGASQLMGKGMDAAAKFLGAEKIGYKSPDFQRMEDLRQNLTKTTNELQGAGFTGEQIAEFFLPMGAVSKVGKVEKAASLGQKALGLAKTVGAEALTAGAISAAQEGELNANVGATALISGAMPVLGAALKKGIGFLGSRLTGKVGTTAEEIASNQMLRKGVKEQYVNLLSNVDDTTKKVAGDYLDAGLNKLIKSDADDVYKYATKESGLDDFIKQLDKTKKALGAAVGEAKTGLKSSTIPKVNLLTEASSLDDILSKYNVKKSADGVLKFGQSELAGQLPAQKQLQKIYNIFTKGKRSVNARDLEAITGQIDQASGLLKTSGLKVGDPAMDALKGFKQVINKVVGVSDEGFGKANIQYADFIKQYKQIKRAGDVLLDSGKRTFNPTQILKRSLTTGDVKYKDAIGAMDDIAKRFNLKPPKNLNIRAQLADMAEKLTQTAPSRSLGSELMQNTETLASQVPALGKIVKTKQMLGEVFTGKGARPIQEQVMNIKKILEESLKRGGSKVTLPVKEANSLLTILSQIMGAGIKEATTKI